MKAISTHRGGQRGQALVVTVLSLFAIIGMVALVLEGGNAYAEQRRTQNGTDAAAQAGAGVLAKKLAGQTVTDADVRSAVNGMGNSNGLTAGPPAWYTTVGGQLINSAGTVVASTAAAAAVGGVGAIPAGAQGVRVQGSRDFGTTFGRVVGFTTFTATADATAVSGKLKGGAFLPVVFPINIVDCANNGSVGSGEVNWVLSEPGSPPGPPEYIVPLCKTGGGSFMVLDLDGIKNNCVDEVINPPTFVWKDFPVLVDSDNGNNCAKPMTDAINALHGKVVLVPICDVDCVTSGGSNAQYKIVKVAAFYVDYFSDSNNQNNSACQAHVGSTGLPMTPIAGNGSSSCLAGWFVKYVTQGPVSSGLVGNSDAIGIQLVR